MQLGNRSSQAGFTLIELMITVAILGILASIALGQYRDYTRRAKMSEVLLAVTNCKTRISESYLSLPSPPASGGVWGCDPAPTGRFATAMRTSVDGAIRVTIDNLDPSLNGRYMHLVPARPDGVALRAADVGNAVGRWLCGSDSQPVRNVLPADCRVDTTPYADADYE